MCERIKPANCKPVKEIKPQEHCRYRGTYSAKLKSVPASFLGFIGDDFVVCVCG